MKTILFLLLSFYLTNSFAAEKTYLIQVIRIADGEQLYGLHSNESDKNQRLSDANKLHVAGQTNLIFRDITAEIAAKEQEKVDRKNLIKDKNANTKDRLEAVIKYLGLDK
jgi:hypothetical protein